MDPAPSGRALLRAYEPVLRFTAGELFLPTAVGPYVARCSLWAGGPDRAAAPLVPAALHIAASPSARPATPLARPDAAVSSRPARARRTRARPI